LGQGGSGVTGDHANGTASAHALSILDVFPPGRRREAVMALAQHPEFDLPGWQGRIIFRAFRTDKSQQTRLGLKIEPDEETVL
jgi:hypothetical protein